MPIKCYWVGKETEKKCCSIFFEQVNLLSFEQI